MTNSATQLSMDLFSASPAIPAWCSTLVSLIDRLDDLSQLTWPSVIPWACPVPFFGDPHAAVVATLGLNPSNREFLDEGGRELQGQSRRFPTLHSLGLKTWGDLDAQHLRAIVSSCRSYFWGRPYLTWFNRMNDVLAGANASYFGLIATACHLDLIPYATARKWNQVGSFERAQLLADSGRAFGQILQSSSVRLLILNGASVVSALESVLDLRLERQEVQAWTLRRKSKYGVLGIAYSGYIRSVSGVQLEREIQVLGFNHNLQSSFGVKREVVLAIAGWIADAVRVTEP